MALLSRVGDSWVKLSGEFDDPRYIFVCDRVGRELVKDVGGFGIEERDLVVQIQVGSFENIRQFFASQPGKYERAEAVILLWVGMDELAQEIPVQFSTPAIDQVGYIIKQTGLVTLYNSLALLWVVKMDYPLVRLNMELSFSTFTLVGRVSSRFMTSTRLWQITGLWLGTFHPSFPLPRSSPPLLPRGARLVLPLGGPRQLVMPLASRLINIFIWGFVRVLSVGERAVLVILSQAGVFP